MIPLPVIVPCLFVGFRFLSMFAANIDLVEPSELLPAFGATLAVVAVTTLVLARVLADAHRASAIACVWLAVSFFSGPVAEATSGVAAALLLGLPAAAASFALLRIRAEFAGLTRVLAIGIAVGTAIPLVQIVLHAVAGASGPRFEHPALAEFDSPGDIGALERPDIYYIVLDGYGRHDVLEQYYGHDNSEFLRFLASKGFYVAERSRSNYGQTILSLASSLNFTYLDDLVAYPGEDSGNKAPLVDMIRQSSVVDFLKRRGYRFVSFASGYNETEMKGADVYLRPRGSLSEAEQVLADQMPLLRLAVGGSLFEAHRRRVLFALEELADLAQIPSPKFVFAHIVAPHPPFVFEADGSPAPTPKRFAFFDGNAFLEYASLDEYLRGYAAQLTFLNGRLEHTLARILEASPQSIVIVQGDHGPGSRYHHEKASETDFVERFSILNALYLPGGGDEALYPELSPVNIFRVVFNEYFDSNFELLPDESYYSTFFRPYRFTRVTDEAKAGPARD